MSPGWDGFALENDVPGATADTVVGRGFFDQVAALYDGVDAAGVVVTSGSADAVRPAG